MSNTAMSDTPPSNAPQTVAPQTAVSTTICPYQTLNDTYLPSFDDDIAGLFIKANLPDRLDEACRYAMAGGGKRIRPLLACFSFLDLVGDCPKGKSGNDSDALGDKVACDMMRRACLAVELLHGYSLIHDDLPCMDDDALRRGRATCHIAFGEDVALLAGDVLQTLAFESLTMTLPNMGYDDTLAIRLHQIFAPCARRMVAGQMRDVLGESQSLSQDELQAIHADKTGALIEASVLMGGACAGVSDDVMAKLLDFACCLGLAFQVQDDVLDVVADSAVLGKSAHSDEKLDKSTYVKLLGIKDASSYATQLFANAERIAKRLSADHLLNLSQIIQKRCY